MYFATMTKRGSLVTEGVAKTPTIRRNFDHWADQAEMLGSPVSSRIFPLFPYVSRPDSMSTVNNIGYKVYVDHAAPHGGDGHSWSTAYNNLNELMNNPWLYYTCSCQKQVVHVYVRGEVTYPLYRYSAENEHKWGETIWDYKNYLVIHDAIFTWDTSVCIPFGTSPPLPYEGIDTVYVAFSGINFYNCTFTLIQQNGKDGIGIDDYGNGARGKAPSITCLIGGWRLYTTDEEGRDCLFHDYVYLKTCSIIIRQGNGGAGAKGSSDYERRTYGGYGGDTRMVVLLENASTGLLYYSKAILDECTVNVEFGSPGNGGDGADGIGGHGGDSGDVAPVMINAYKMYKCHISGTYAPTFHGGNGGSYTGNPDENSGGRGGHIYTDFPFGVYSGWCNHCTIDLTVDMQNAQAGDGGNGASGVDSSGNTITELGARGTPGQMDEPYNPVCNISYCANTTITIHKVHHGTGLYTMGGRVLLSLDDCYKSKLNIIDDLKFGLKESPSQSYTPTFYLPSYSVACGNCTDVDVTFTFTKNAITLPSYGNLYEVNAAGDRAQYSLGGCVGGPYNNHNDLYLMIEGNPTFPSSYSADGTYGMRVKMSKPPVFYGGYPSGGSIWAYGVVVHGADGLDEEFNDDYIRGHEGGDASNSFTFNGLNVSAGTPGKGTYSANDGRFIPEAPYTINSTTSKDVEITFI